MMPTLHIEHAISDLETWMGAFRQFAEARAGAGVTREVIRQPVDDPKHIVVDLEFDTAEQAAAFLGFLRANVWSNPEASPALVGQPEAQVLEVVHQA
jgi:hypothetical protein